MKKNIIQRGFLGFPLGITIGFIIAMIVSICIGDGVFHVANPKLIAIVGNELNAVLFQSVFSGIIGTGFAMASIIWDISSWSLAKQSGVYFAIASIILLPISYFLNWMPHTIKGMLSYISIFVVAFIFVWLVQYFVLRSKIKKMNDKIKK